MKWIRRLLGTDFPDPVVGQIWRCARNGDLLRVSDVSTCTSGTVFVTCERWITKVFWPHSGPHWGMGDTYAVGLPAWRSNLRAQSRHLVPPEDDPRTSASRPVTRPHAPLRASYQSPPYRPPPKATPAPAASTPDEALTGLALVSLMGTDSHQPPSAPAASYSSGGGGDFSGGGASGSWDSGASSSSSSDSSSSSSDSSSSSSSSD